jgi:deferrochelatase/peroxidase EfeB
VTVNNDFEFSDDPDGAICPLAAHIRKAYPRDDQTTPDLAQSESSTQTHRLLRRGIPFGNSFGAPQRGGAHDPRGLLFLAYQKDIELQFEFVQQSWVNNNRFPPFPASSAPGQDPIIAQNACGPFQLAPGKAPITVNHFVTTTGGEYFCCPSIDALQKLETRRSDPARSLTDSYPRWCSGAGRARTSEEGIVVG